jgi:hypothetical protein
VIVPFGSMQHGVMAHAIIVAARGGATAERKVASVILSRIP